MLERGRKPGDLILFQTVLLPGLGVARMAHPGTILFLAKQGGQSGGLVDSGRELPVESTLFSMGIRVSSLGDAKPRQESTHVREKPSGFELGLG
jgi:hypothetical protein